MLHSIRLFFRHLLCPDAMYIPVNRDTFASSRRPRVFFSVMRSARPPGNQIAHLSQTLIGAKQSYRSVTSVWYNGIAPFSLEFAWDGFGSPFFYFGLANRLSGLPKFESVSALGFLFEFPSSLAHLYNTIFRPSCQAFYIIFLQIICICSRKRLSSPAQMS